MPLPPVQEILVILKRYTIKPAGFRVVTEKHYDFTPTAMEWDRNKRTIICRSEGGKEVTVSDEDAKRIRQLLKV